MCLVQSLRKNMRGMKSVFDSYLVPHQVYNFSPADNSIQFSLYFADTQKDLVQNWDLRRTLQTYSCKSSRWCQIFHFIEKCLVKHCWGVNQNPPGLYGKTAAYYAAVDSKGRWLCICTSSLDSELIISQELEIELWTTNSIFKKRIVEYLESVHVGEFMTGTMDEVKEQVMKIWSKDIKILLRLCLMLLQNPQTVTVTNVNLVKIQPAGGKFSKILWMI